MNVKKVYSLFGDKEKGYRRFLYDPYLPRVLNSESCIFDLTAEQVGRYYQIAWDLTAEVCHTLTEVLGEGHRIWPVDRFLITSMTHALLYGEASGKVFLDQHGGEIASFVAQRHRPDATPLSVVKYPLLAMNLGLVERALCAVLKANGTLVTYESKEPTRYAPVKRFSRMTDPMRERAKRWVRMLAWCGRMLLAMRDRPLLMYYNGFIGKEELTSLKGAVTLHYLDLWNYLVVQRVQRHLSTAASQSQHPRVRDTWRSSLHHLAERFCQGVLRELLPAIADVYPISLLEERGYLLRQARRFIRIMQVSTRNNRQVLSLDHASWKYDWAGALAQALVEAGHLVVGHHHGPNGHWRYDIVDALDPVLKTHFVSITRKPFLHVPEKLPEIVQVAFPRQFLPNGRSRDLPEDKKVSIWFFPHYLQVDLEDGVHFYFTDHFRPENYFERTATTMAAFRAIANHPKVKEVVIKPKPASIYRVDKYREFITGFVSKDRSGKIRLANRHMTMTEALPYVSIAVHDMVSTPAFQTLFCHIPSIILLGEQEDPPDDLKADARWVEFGMFLKDPAQLEKTLLTWIRTDFTLPEDLLRTFKADWCGAGKPRMEEHLRQLLLA